MKYRSKKLTSIIVVVMIAIVMSACNQMQNNNENVEIIQDMYDAFSSGDVPSVLAKMSPDIVWNEAENFPYADGNPYIGPDAIVEGVFARIGQDWDGFELADQNLYSVEDNMVLVTGRYRGTHLQTGKSMNAQHVHLWWLEDGMVTRFQQYADTKQAWDVSR